MLKEIVRAQTEGFNRNPVTLDSREVAEMLEKEHWQVLRDIEGSKDGKSLGIIQVLSDNKLGVSDYFIEDSYKDTTGKNNKCYLVTKMGCEVLGNKQQGTKGILFTAKYVKKFNQMEQGILVKQLTPLEQLRLQYQVIEEHEQDIKDIKEDITNIKVNSPLFNIECDELQNAIKQKVIKMMGGKPSIAYEDRSLRGRVFADMQKEVKRQFGLKSYKAIKRGNLEKAYLIIEEYKLPYILENEITLLNNQIAM
ncbi:Rha family transcriptional regulator [Clostridium frigidicarnis]|uniref:Phage regulatory protein Rha n=1 Tax=Clostridium frigidicarnis TaxID=84698 RepID=A0A1I0V3T1_9CLOT|nr:Rha family transcriptional regulator [Clostridium frigidicarnis]SFA70773.1 Phage regulatory protein Rha [Clostridium frigidicarnis]